MALVERSAPSQSRPRLAEEYERELAASDRRRAAMYASMEDISDQFDQVAEKIAALDLVVPVMVVDDDDAEDSLVTTIDAVVASRHG